MAVKPSSRLFVLLLLSHALVAIVVHATALPSAARLALLVIILLSLFYYLARDALLLLPGSWREISLENSPHPNLLDGTARGLRRGFGSVSVDIRDGSTFSGKITGRTVITSCFVVLCVRPEGRYSQVFRVIFPDMLGADEFRDLCVRLRFA